jgi:hypothetical protein
MYKATHPEKLEREKRELHEVLQAEEDSEDL